MPETVNLKVIPPETVARWRREESLRRLERTLCRAAAETAIRTVWWAVLFFAGYVAALVIGAGCAA